MVHNGLKIRSFIIVAITMIFQGITFSSAMDSTADNPNLDTITKGTWKLSDSPSYAASTLERTVEDSDTNIQTPTAAPYTLKPITILTFADVSIPSVLPPNIIKAPAFYPTLKFIQVKGLPKRQFASDSPSLSPNWSDTPSMTPSDLPSYAPNWSDVPSQIPSTAIDKSDIPSLSPSMFATSIPISNGIVGVLVPKRNPSVPVSKPLKDESSLNKKIQSDSGEKKGGGCTKIGSLCRRDCCGINVCYKNVCTNPRRVPNNYVEGDVIRNRKPEKKYLQESKTVRRNNT